MSEKEKEKLNNLERLVGISTLQNPQGQQIAEEVIEDLAQKQYKDFHHSGLFNKVKGFVTNGTLATASGAAAGYLAGGEEGAIVGAQYGATLYTTLWAGAQSLRSLFKKRGVQYDDVSDKLKDKVNNSIGANLNFTDEPVSTAIVMGLVSGGIMAGVSYPTEWISSVAPYAQEVVSQAKETGISPFEIGLLFGTGGFLRSYAGALKSNSKIRKRFSEVADEEQINNPNLDALLSNEEIQEGVKSHLKETINNGVLDTEKGDQFANQTIRDLITKYYNANVKPAGLVKTATGFAKKLGLTSLAGAAVGYLAGSEEGAVAGAQYGASLYTMLYASLNGLKLFKKSNPKSSLEKTIEHCKTEVKKSIDTSVKTYRNPIGTGIGLTAGMGLFLAGASYIHDWAGSNLEVINQIVQNADDVGISAFKIGALFGAATLATQYKQASSFVKDTYKKLDRILFTDRPEKARMTSGSVHDLNSFTRTNSEGILETPIIEYENRDGKRITFVGAVHMGEKEYFGQLQQVLDQYETVFYEGVKKGNSSLIDRLSGAGVLLSSMMKGYKKMKGSYHLAFQGEEIDYKRDNWENVDTDAKGVIDRLNKSDTVAGGIAKQALFYVGSALASGVTSLMNSVFYIPKTKLTEQLSKKKEKKGGLFDDAILKYRNEVVMERLGQFDSGNARNTAVFYGAAHLDELHKHVTTDLGYKPKNVTWIEAW